MADAPAGETFETFIGRERDRLMKERDGLKEKQKALDAEFSAIDREMVAINAYEAAKKGRAPGTGQRARRGSRQESLLELIGKHKDGVNRGAILEELGLRGNKSGEQSVSNALSALKKKGAIESRDGKYFGR